MMISIARIEVQEHFCEDCASLIRNKLSEVDQIKNVRLYPKEALITFCFRRANELSTVLNVLSNIGYHEKEEKIITKQCELNLCNC
ncbi:hypothetical protein [Aquimarina latercula]|uniref:hypothetical protein n=1 Tax=Aquimarina latercula TaxID=987 RepID=UPI000558311C|nr:hypothetical protein [Aquimarina latercula]